MVRVSVQIPAHVADAAGPPAPATTQPPLVHHPPSTLHVENANMRSPSDDQSLESPHSPKSLSSTSPRYRWNPYGPNLNDSFSLDGKPTSPTALCAVVQPAVMLAEAVASAHGAPLSPLQNATAAAMNSHGGLHVVPPAVPSQGHTGLHGVPVPIPLPVATQIATNQHLPPALQMAPQLAFSALTLSSGGFVQNSQPSASRTQQLLHQATFLPPALMSMAAVSHPGHDGGAMPSQPPTTTALNFLTEEQIRRANNALSMLRQQRRDSLVLPLLSQLHATTLSDLAAYLSASPDLVLELCEKERGNVVAQLIQTLGGDACDALVAVVLSNAARLATHQSGCIAFSRIFDSANARQRALLSQFVVDNFLLLTLHPFGNYVAQRVLQEATDEIYAAVFYIFTLPSSMCSISGDKFGSHVIEVFLQRAPFDMVAQLVLLSLQNPETAMHLCVHGYGNYALQCAMRRLQTSQQVRNQAIELIKPYLPLSPYAQNIVKSWSVPPRQ